jgi:hypothetical protein
MLAAFALVALVGVRVDRRVCTFPFAGSDSDRLSHSHPWIESGSVARHRMVRFLIMFACRPHWQVGRAGPSSTRYLRDSQERITRNADPGRRTVTELLVPTKRAAITLISHSIGGDAIAVVICLVTVDMHWHRVTV